MARIVALRESCSPGQAFVLGVASAILATSCTVSSLNIEPELALETWVYATLNETTSLARLEKQLADCREVAVDEKAESRNQPDYDLEDELKRPADRCARIVYVLSPVMPLSLLGIEYIATAAKELEIDLTLMDGEALSEWLNDSSVQASTFGGEAIANQDAPHQQDTLHVLASEMLAAGATVHYPAILVYNKGNIVGSAILGLKTEDAYREMISVRLSQGNAGASAGEMGAHLGTSLVTVEGNLIDIEVEGRPGAYFRYIPGRDALGFESRRQNYILGLKHEQSFWAPGMVDLVPSPDGRFLVTVRNYRGGLEFHDAAEIFASRVPARTTSHPPEFTPLHVDHQMRDQYPSVGILEQRERSADYRVLTSWFDGIVHRDYEIHYPFQGGQAEVRPLGEPTQTCPSYKLSTPIIAKDGREVAARDEATGTTKIFRINNDLSCAEVLNIGMQTGKVAWDSTGSRIAFAVPRGVADENAGVFVLDREDLSLTRIPGSVDVNHLTFPEFVEDTSVIFLIRGGADSNGRTRFRRFCCLK